MARKLKKGQEEIIESVDAEEVAAPVEDALTANEEGTPVEEVSQVAQCGARLRSVRIEQGLTTQVVAKQLRLSNTQIEALEADDFAALPEPTIVKGFIRNYAKLLKTPADAMLSAYAEMTPEATHYAVGLNPGINMKISEKEKSSVSRYLLLAILFLLGLGVWAFYQSYIQKPDISNSMADISEALPAFDLQMPNAGQEPALPEIPAEAPVETPLAESEPLTNEQGADATALTSSDVAAEEVVAEEVATEEVASVDASESETETLPASGTRLEFNATQETWVSVVNQSGKEVYNKILYEGNRDVVNVSQPSEIVVGNAHGATLVVDGQSIDLAPYTRTNVARVRLSP